MQPKPKLQAVLDGDLDAALMRSAPPTPGIAWVQLASQRAVAVVAADHPLAGEASVTLAQLAPFPLAVIARREPERRRGELAAICRAAGVEPVFGAILANGEEALAAISMSQAWTIAADGNSGPGTVQLDLVDEVEPLAIWLAHRAQPRRAVQHLAEAARCSS